MAKDGGGVTIELPTDEIKLQRPTKREIDRALRPYAHELGLLVIHWNELHERLGYLFKIVSGMPDTAAAFAVWHSQVSDRSQRAMLRAALDCYHPKSPPKSWKDDVVWILNEADNGISRKRNNAIHSSLMLWKIDGELLVFPNWLSGNTKANSFAGKALLLELRYFNKLTAAVLSFTIQACRYLDGQRRTWPARPRMPHRPDRNEARPQSSQERRKKRKQ